MPWRLEMTLPRTPPPTTLEEMTVLESDGTMKGQSDWLVNFLTIKLDDLMAYHLVLMMGNLSRNKPGLKRSAWSRSLKKRSCRRWSKAV
jgi:hypothetical protein